MSNADQPPLMDSVRAEEHANVGFEWGPVTRVRIQKRVVTEIQSIEVEVRREEIVIESEPVAHDEAVAFPIGQAPVPAEPVSFVLRAEVPVVSLAVQPYETVTVATVVRTEQKPLTVSLRQEQITSENL